ncbi:MAG: hypothetical protein KF690_05965 [Bacteroidetes bacterium]|nr:hypothetical protein [Bacteroidota bacterium]
MKKLLLLFLLVGASPLFAQDLVLPAKEAISDSTLDIAPDITATLCATAWKEVGNWDNRGFGNDLDYSLLEDTYVSQIVVYYPNGTYARYACEPFSSQKGRLVTKGKWAVAHGWISLTDDTGDFNKCRLIKVRSNFLVYDLMNRYRTAFISVP